MKTLTQIIFILIIIISQPLYAETNPRIKEIIAERCSHCHGENGEASNTIYPRLAGQHKEYMVKQLQNFRSGERTGTMNDIAKDLTDEEMIGLAEYFSAQPPAKHRVRDKEFAAVGKYIFFKGNKFSGVASCSSCHGDKGHGTNKLPRLAGQHKRYVSIQLEEFNNRKRTNDNHIMQSVAAQLTEFEREAVSLYVSGLE